MIEDFAKTSGAGIIVVIVFCMVFLGVGAVLRQIDHHYRSINCPKQAISYKRQTKFVDYNYWSYECLVKADNGTYVNINNLINNVQN